LKDQLSLLPINKMTDRIYSPRVGDKLMYPTWKSLILSLPFTKEGKNVGLTQDKEAMAAVMKNITAIQKKRNGFFPELAKSFVSEAKGTYHTGKPIEEVKVSMDNFNFGTNEFHTIYDIPSASYTYVSDRVYSILGIPPEEFNVQRLYSLMPEGGLHHPADVYHTLRWGNLAYIVLGIPGFVFRANDDHYLIRYRLSTAISKFPEIREMEYVMVEKRCYLCHDSSADHTLKPTMHLDRWTVLDSTKHHFVQPQFVTSPNQSMMMNAMLYLLNCMLIGLQPKYIMFMNERIETDRNKAIAIGVSEKMQQHSGLKPDLMEKTVADCFSKSIRTRIADALETWEPRPDKHIVNSDADAVKGAYKLGLLPIPPMVEKLMYSSITEA
jgi:hypothetical protein